MAETRKTPMPSGNVSQGDPYSTVHPANRKRESATAPAPTGARTQVECGKDYRVDEQSSKKVD